MRFLMSNPTTSFTPRILSSKLKGVRGLGGSDGIIKILQQLQELKLVQFVNNNKAISLRDDRLLIRIFKKICAICDLEGLQEALEPISSKGILFGSRATGMARSDSDYDLLIVSDIPEEVRKTVTRHPLGKKIELFVYTPEEFIQIEKQDPALSKLITKGIVMWGLEW